MNKSNWRREGVAWVAMALVVVATLLFYPRLPDPMPIHWNAAGQADDWASRQVGAWLMPLAMLAVYLLLLALPAMDPRRANIARFEGTYSLMRVGTTLFFAYMQGVILYATSRGGNDLPVGLITSGVGVLFLLIGNYMPRMRSNWFMGIRTPWTLASEHVWRATHRLGGRLFMLAGVGMLLLPLFPAEWIGWLIIPLILIASFVPIAYSYWVFRREQASEPPHRAV